MMCSIALCSILIVSPPGDHYKNDERCHSLQRELDLFCVDAYQANDMRIAASHHFNFYEDLFRTNWGIGNVPSEWSRDSKWCQEVWDAYYSANVAISFFYKQQAMNELKFLLGPGYNLRVLPPPSPAWTFHDGGPMPKDIFPPSKRK